MRVLVVEDEFGIAKPLRNALEREGYMVSVSDTGQGAIKLTKTWKPDVILLDLMLPDIDGREVAKQIRAFSGVPIIMVTARAEESDRIVGLEIGADDYVTKPYSLGELMARIRAVTRRAKGTTETTTGALTFKDLMLEPDTYRVFRAEEQLSLSQKEFEILRMLMEHPGAVVSRADLVHGVWNLPLYEGSKTLDVHMSWLRRKLGDEASSPEYIETVRGVGFRLAT
ncbi:MAG: response regulator transcription factor [Actinomycetota bacterium]|nr:response regulator transcription factor [Actinomycetota bacterium]